MDKKEADFLAKLLATFKIEADEHLKNLSDGLIALEGTLSAEARQEHVETIYRESHSLKGAARSVNYTVVQEICQAMETVLSAWKQKRIEQSRLLFETLYAVVDYIGKLILLPPTPLQGEEINLHKSLIDKLNTLQKGESPVPESSSPPPQVLPEPAKIQPPPPSLEPPSAAEKIVAGVGVPVREKTIRISVQKLDKLFQQVEEMLIVKMTVRQQVSAFKSLQTDLRIWQKEWGRFLAELQKMDLSERVWEILHWQAHVHRSVRERLNRMSKMASQDYRFVGSMIDTLLEDSKKVLVQPFSTLFDTLPRMVRDISYSLGKETRINFIGGEIEVDRRILEGMKDPLIHLVRNAIDHGIEKPEERTKNNKPPYGTITISATQMSGNKVELVISDDGRGIDVKSVIEASLKQGHITESDVEKINDQEALMMIFHSGISTSKSVTELSGRGLGMSIVSEKVDKLGGQLQVESKRGLGTSFKIQLPLTLATFRGIHLTVLSQDFIMPSYYVKIVLRIPTQDIMTLENRPTIIVNGKYHSFAYLGEILGLGKIPTEQKTVCVIVIKAAEKLVAIGVDSILNEQEVLVKGLGKQLIRVRNLLAATIMEWGKVVPILNPIDLVKSVLQFQK